MEPRKSEKEEPQKVGQEIANPLKFTLTEAGGKAIEVILDGDECVPVAREKLAKASNNLEYAIRGGAFAGLPLDQLHAVLGLSICLRDLAATSLAED